MSEREGKRGANPPPAGGAEARPQARERRARRGRALRRLIYVAPAIVSSFFLTPASAAPPSGCNPAGGPCMPSSTPCMPNR